MTGWNGRGSLDLFSSEDGLNFEKEKELEIEGKCAMPLKLMNKFTFTPHNLRKKSPKLSFTKAWMVWTGKG